jgi:hypothetical protein
VVRACPGSLPTGIAHPWRKGPQFAHSPVPSHLPPKLLREVWGKVSVSGSARRSAERRGTLGELGGQWGLVPQWRFGVPPLV